MLETFIRKVFSNTETKPAIYTTEFWLHAVFQLLLWVEALPTEGAPAWVKTVVSAAAFISLVLSRGAAKGGVAPK